MLCKPCYANRTRRDGGDLGLCWQHKKSKCQICGALSAGNRYCSTCDHKENILRMQAESQPLYSDDDHKYINNELREQKLTEARYHAFRAVEVLFRSISLVHESMSSSINETNDELPQKPTEEIFKEAA